MAKLGLLITLTSVFLNRGSSEGDVPPLTGAWGCPPDSL